MKKLLVLILVFLMACPVALAAFNETGLPIVTEGEGFSILVDESGNPEDKIMLKAFEEETGVKVEVLAYPYQAALERMGILLNSGDYPEVIGGWLLGTQDILDLSADGTLIPLDDLIEKYSPNMKEILSNPAVKATFTLPDGHVYTIPYVIAEPEVCYKPFINKKWLDNLGLSVPTTTEELKQVLIAFRDEDANGNGDKTDEIPFSGDPNNLSFANLTGYFGVDAANKKNEYGYYELKDGKLHFTADTDEFKAAMEFYADLYAEKLIDPEIFTQDLAMWKSKGEQDLYGVCVAYGSGDFMEWTDDETGEYDKVSQFVPLPVLSSPNCDAPLFHRDTNGVTMFRTQVALTDKCDEQTAAIIIRWFDNTFTEDNSAQCDWGPLGINIEKIEDLVYRSLPQDDWDDAKKDQYSWSNFYLQSLPKYKRDMKLLAAVGAKPSYDENKITDDLYRTFLNSTFVQTWGASEEDTNRASTLRTDIDSYIKEKMAQWISGEASIAEEWEGYKAQLKTYGIDELTEINARISGLEIYK